jgi:hypothetical protein
MGSSRIISPIDRAKRGGVLAAASTIGERGRERYGDRVRHHGSDAVAILG